MEIEYKFQIPPDRLAAVEEDLRQGPVQPLRLRARYFDTPDGALAAQSIVLRLRQEGDRWVQTVKAPGCHPLERHEHNADLGQDAAAAPALPDLSRHEGTPAGRLLRLVLAHAGAGLVGTYGTDIQRLVRQVRQGDALVALALDQGRVIAHAGTPDAVASEVCELELELLDGPVGDLAALAAEWAGRHGLWFSTLSKAERGQRLLAGRASGAAVHAAPLQLARGQDDGLALQRAMVANCLAQVLPNASEIAAGIEDGDLVHQLRVGLRRLRTALRELDGLGAGAFDAGWTPPLVDAFRALGTLRDGAEVVQRFASPLRDAGAPRVEIPAGAHAAPGAADVVRAPAFQRTLVALIGFAAGGGPAPAEPLGPQAARRYLRHRLRRLHRAVVGAAQDFEGLDAAQQHRVRKRLKRLRYLAEFAASLFRARAAERYLAQLKPVQEALGSLNDTATAAALYCDAAQSDPLAWFAAGWLESQRPGCARASRKALAALRRQAEPFWRRR
ncbi:CYTH and CHAD domain-containing protein [Xylophilus sp.]|uniref:CYTH and CHAD domain-containing protein n=1 Tax=Xylophilus sp. TaxID=2653893 RepID=UPI002D7FAEDC|nr:CHAD domain-containing protein [Xylophilus sp.]